MSHLLISEKNKQKLDILKLLLFSDEGLYIQAIMAKQTLSKSTTFRYLSELQDDLTSLFTHDEIKIEKAEISEAYIVVKSDALNNDLIIDSIRLTYIQDSNMYQVLLTLIQKNISTANQLAEEVGMSLPTVYSCVAKLNEFFSIFDVKFVFQTKIGALIGNEVGVRYALYYIYWFIFKTDDRKIQFSHLPPFLLDTSAVIQSYPLSTADLTLSQHAKLKLIQSIILYRTIYQQKTIDLPDSFYEDVHYLYNPNLTFDQHFEEKISPEIKLNEKKFMSVVLRGFISDIDSYEQKKEIVTNYLASDLAISQHVQSFLADFQQAFKSTFNDELYIETFYLLLLAVIYYKHIGIDLTAHYEQDVTTNRFETIDPLYKQLEENILDFIQLSGEKWPLGFKSKTRHELIQLSHLLISSLYLNRPVTQLHIYLQFSGNIYFGQVIKRFITNHLNHEATHFTSNPEIADVTISDTHAGSYPQSKNFYFEHAYDPSTWQNLILFLSKELWNKDMRL